jgi:Ca2+:H+ antiporter
VRPLRPSQPYRRSDGRSDLHDEQPGSGVLAGAAHVRRRHRPCVVRAVRRAANGPASRLLSAVPANGNVIDADHHATLPSTGQGLRSLALLLAALVGVVGNAKLVSPTIERAVVAAGLPVSVVGVVIAMLILLPETLAAVRAARRGRMQISLNLAFGSAMASIGLTIPTIAVASIWLPVPLHLGLDATHIVLFALTCVVTVLTVVPGRATLLQAGVHLALLAAYLFLAINP